MQILVKLFITSCSQKNIIYNFVLPLILNNAADFYSFPDI